jgi:hypothetical protein
MEKLPIAFIIASAGIAISFIIFLHIKRWSKKIRVNLNTKEGIQKFIELLFVFDQKVVFLNIILTPDLASEFKNGSTISLPQVYRSKSISGGFKVKFDSKNMDRLMKEAFIEPNRIKGYFKIIHEAGPELGWYTILLQFPEK